MTVVQNLLNGRLAIIKGASRGIGAAIARRFAAESSGHLVPSIPMLRQLHVNTRILDSSIMTKKPDNGQGGL